MEPDPERMFQQRSSLKPPENSDAWWNGKWVYPGCEYVADDRATAAGCWLLLLAPRDQSRKFAPILFHNLLGPLSSTLSRKWSTVAIPVKQLRHFDDQRLIYPTSVTLLRMLVPPEVDLVGLGALLDLPRGLRKLTLDLGHALEVRGLDMLYQRLPPYLVELKIMSDGAWGNHVEGGPNFECMALLVNALERLHHLQVFQHDNMHIGDLDHILGALSTRAAAPQTVTRRLRSLTLGLLIFDDMVPMQAGSRIQFGVDALNVHVVAWGIWDGSRDASMCDVLSALPPPTCSLRLVLPRWIERSVETVAAHFLSMPLENLSLDSAKNRRSDEEVMSDELGFDCKLPLHLLKVPGTLKSLVVTRCLSFNSVHNAVARGWTLPNLPMLTRLNLSHNGLATDDLVALQPRWPPNLMDLNLSNNKISTLVVPFPPKLRRLNVSRNHALGYDLYPEAWIEALPLTLREINVNRCSLSTRAMELLSAARERLGVWRATGEPKLHILS
ncbi:hypothetical protein GGF31_003656 [Allomyces arbusculus]|nr:hypothetical protein GGF31_003656 [Allomyces arbusculus]